MGAKKSFDKCMATDPEFIRARREVSMLRQQNNKQGVSGFFRRR